LFTFLGLPLFLIGGFSISPGMFSTGKVISSCMINFLGLPFFLIKGICVGCGGGGSASF